MYFAIFFELDLNVISLSLETSAFYLELGSLSKQTFYFERQFLYRPFLIIWNLFEKLIYLC